MLTGRTKTAAVIGDPVRHSFSPALHNAAFAALELDWVYVAFGVADGSGAQAVAAMKTLGLNGLSVTMPHKAAVAAAADERSEAVASLEAANCLSWVNGRIRADNTDVAGFLDAVRIDAGVELHGKRCGVIGAGGAAKACIYGLATAGVSDIVVVNRSRARAVEAVRLAGSIGRVGQPADLADVDIVINATSIGMETNPGHPIEPHLLRPGQVYFDLIYAPAETETMAALRDRGLEVHNGLSMLLHQAAHAFTIWTGQPAPIEAMRQVLSGLDL